MIMITKGTNADLNADWIENNILVTTYQHFSTV